MIFLPWSSSYILGVQLQFNISCRFPNERRQEKLQKQPVRRRSKLNICERLNARVLFCVWFFFIMQRLICYNASNEMQHSTFTTAQRQIIKMIDKRWQAGYIKNAPIEIVLVYFLLVCLSACQFVCLPVCCQFFFPSAIYLKENSKTSAGEKGLIKNIFVALKPHRKSLLTWKMNGNAGH